MWASYENLVAKTEADRTAPPLGARVVSVDQSASFNHVVLLFKSRHVHEARVENPGNWGGHECGRWKPTLAYWGQRRLVGGWLKDGDWWLVDGAQGVSVHRTLIRRW